MKLKRFLALLLAAALLGGLPAWAAADEAPLPEDEFALGEASEYGDIAIFDDTAEEAPAGSAPAPSFRRRGGIPASYDPRESGGYLPPVRSQGSWNTCWSVAAIGAAEAYGLKRGLLTTSASETDLSERHLIYFFSHQSDDPLGNSSQDHNISPAFWIQSGGNPVIATMAMACWHGPADETATNSPYSGLTTNDSLDPSYAYADEIHLENTCAVDISADSGRSALKSMILEHGGAVLCMYYNASYLFAGSPPAQGEEPDPGDDPGPILDGSDEPVDELPAADPASEHSEEEPAPDDGEPEETASEGPEDAPAEDVPGEETPSPAEDADQADPVPAEDPEVGSEDDSVPPEESDPVGEVIGLDGDPDPGEDLPPDEEEPETEDFTVCYYQDTSTTTNHEVLIIGWDDDYPRENFAFSSAISQAIIEYMEEANADLEEGDVPMDYATAREEFIPSANGAWLCRNSHGSSWAGGDGCFWVSYYDLSVSAPTNGSISSRATVFSFAPADNYDNNYEYDGAAILGYVNDSVSGRGVSTASAGPDTQRWYANVFTSCGNRQRGGTELLRAVSTYTYRADVSYTAQVYTDLADAADPASGTLAAEISGTFQYAGYHTVVLPESVPLGEGETFSVVFRIGRASDNSVYVPACYTSSNWRSTNETLAGESFVSLNGSEWLDCKGLRNEPNVRIKAFTDNVDAVFPFADVSESAWYYDDVRTSWLKYLVNGTAADVYEPAVTATRAQVVTVLWRLAGEPAPEGSAGFSDVSAGAWYADAVTWAAESGLVYGYADGLFRPGHAITRQEFMAVLCRYAQLRGMDTSPQADITVYPDVGSVGYWAKQAVSWSIASGIMQGVESSDGVIRLDPCGSVTRAQLAAFLNRFSDLLP